MLWDLESFAVLVDGIAHELREIGVEFSEPVGEVGAVDVHLSKALQARCEGFIEITHVLVPAGDNVLNLGACLLYTSDAADDN